jgi:hypothetical protein
MTGDEIVLGPLPKGITLAKEGMQKRVWNVLGHTYYMKASSDSSFAFETYDPPGTGVPPHVQPDPGRAHLRPRGSVHPLPRRCLGDRRRR